MTEQSKKLKGLKVLLGVSGGVAAYKAVALASKLAGLGATVKTVMTQGACEFVRPKSFEAVTGQPVYITLWSRPEEYQEGHVSLTEWADIVVVAPATADIIGKLACGICDDLLSTVLCAAHKKPILIAPAMNNNMWENPAVQRNIKKIKETGCQTIGPIEGRLACGTEGVGRMSEPEDIIAEIEKIK